MVANFTNDIKTLFVMNSTQKLKKVVDARPGEEIFGMTMIVSKGKTILV